MIIRAMNFANIDNEFVVSKIVHRTSKDPYYYGFKTIEKKMKKKFPSVVGKFNDPNIFSFTDPADEAMFNMYAHSGAEIEI